MQQAATASDRTCAGTSGQNCAMPTPTTPATRPTITTGSLRMIPPVSEPRYLAVQARQLAAVPLAMRLELCHRRLSFGQPFVVVVHPRHQTTIQPPARQHNSRRQTGHHRTRHRLPQEPPPFRPRLPPALSPAVIWTAP